MQTFPSISYAWFVIVVLASNFLSVKASWETKVVDTAIRRALPNAPNGYTPEEDSCPSERPVIRSANGLSPSENSWLGKRRNQTLNAMISLLSRLNISNFDAQAYMNENANNLSNVPNIAIAASGGGYRAMLNGAGALAAFDSLTDNSTGAGQLGGILQSATYFSGLSGGSWLVGSIYINNFTSIQAILGDNASGLWNLEYSILRGPPTASDYYRQLIDTVRGKTDAWFNNSITDYWLVSLKVPF